MTLAAAMRAAPPPLVRLPFLKSHELWLPAPPDPDQSVRPRSLVSHEPAAPTLLTTDPVAAAGGWDTPDASHVFPSGSAWKVSAEPENCLRLFRQRGFFHRLVVAAANGLGALDTDELFLFVLDLQWYAANRWDPDLHAQSQGRDLEAYLAPGRRHWGRGQ